jgi:hypothetical protein
MAPGAVMGLYIHNTFEGAYSAFNRFRAAVTAATGGTWPTDPWSDDLRFYYGPGYGPDTHPGLHEFLTHSDCDGEISPEMCAKVADDLEALLPKIEALGWEAWGHLSEGYVVITKRFIAGCREAAAKGEPLLFE